MEDYIIVDMYWDRDEKAICETELKYGGMLERISDSILISPEDAKECVNDTYLAAWNSMPTDRPVYLGAYLSKIVRNLSINRYRANHRKKRAVTADLLCELCECVSDEECTCDSERISEVLNRFLRESDDEKRVMFICRYFNGMSIKEISEKMGASKSKVKTTLCRMRESLRKILQKEDLL